MPSRFTYDLLYRIGAARASRGWDRGVGAELRELVESGRLTPETVPPGRAVDLGCGTGANVLFLAEHGFHATGVDFSKAAVEGGRREASSRGLADRAAFVVADLTAPELAGLAGFFDLVMAWNTLQDLDRGGRRTLAGHMTALTRPGGLALVWCYFARRRDLPLLSYRGPSRLFPFVVAPGEERDLFGEAFEIERLPRPPEGSGFACFLMTRR